jgi:hypothetical protein
MKFFEVQKSKRAFLFIGCGALLVVTMTAKGQRAIPPKSTAAAPQSADAQVTAAGTQKLLALARQLGASDAVTTLECWSAAARSGMRDDGLLSFRQLFQMQLSIAVLSWYDRNPDAHFVPAKPGTSGSEDMGRFEGKGSGPLNAYLDALKSEIPVGAGGPPVTEAGAALAQARPAGTNYSSVFAQWSSNQWISMYSFMLLSRALPDGANPVGLSPPPPPANDLGIQRVLAFKAAIGADTELFSASEVLESEPPPLTLAEIPPSLRSERAILYGPEQGARVPILSLYEEMNVLSDTDALDRDIRRGGIDSPAMRAVESLMRPAGTEARSSELQQDIEGLRSEIASGDGHDLAPLVEGRERQILRMSHPGSNPQSPNPSVESANAASALPQTPAQKLLGLARQLGASDAVATLQVWGDAARKGMPLQDLGALKRLFQLQLTVAVLAQHDKYRETMIYLPGKQTNGKLAGTGKDASAGTLGGTTLGRFEGDGSGPLNKFLTAVGDVRTGPMGPFGDGQRAGNVNTTGSALSVARPVGQMLSDPNWGAVRGAVGGIIEAALPNNASPVGLSPPQASMNTVGLAEVQKFTAAIGGDMQLYNDWMALRSEPLPVAALNIPAALDGPGWGSIGGMERDLKQPVKSQFQSMYINNATKILMADYQKEGPNGAAVQAFLKLANLAWTNSENGTDYHAQGDVNQLGIPDNQSVIPQVVGRDIGGALQDTQPVTAGGPHSN